VARLFRSHRSPRAETPADGVDGPDDSAGDDDLIDDPEGDWLAYELHEWASESRRMLEQLLVGEEVAHAWQGTTLLVHHADEEFVDELIEEVESAAERRLDPDRETLALDMSGGSGDLQAELVSRLGTAGIPHEFDADGDLVVHADDEDVVDLMIDDIMARADELDLEELDGLAVNELLSRLFVACDRLHRDMHDPDGVLGAVEAGRRLLGVRTPFGFEAATWAALRTAAGRLVELIEAEETSEADDEELAELTASLVERLRQLI